jgi:hypothetical protein
MPTIETREAKSWVKCCCCQAQIRTCEKFLQVVKDNGKDLRGERYCPNCEDYAHKNNDIHENTDWRQEDDGEAHLRSMEDYAAYKAAGATDAYWSDRDNGYCN